MLFLTLAELIDTLSTFDGSNVWWFNHLSFGFFRTIMFDIIYFYSEQILLQSVPTLDTYGGM
jgi:hypothetical protein